MENQHIDSLLTSEEIINNLSIFDTWEDKYSYIIDLGKKLVPLSEHEKNEEHQIKGCISRAWLIHTYKKKRLFFMFDSDSAIVKGLSFFLKTLFSGKTPEEIVKINITLIFSNLQLDQHLSPSRSNGFRIMIEKIHNIADQRIQIEKKL